MRPSLLDPLFAALTTIPGVGPKLEKLYRKLLDREDTPARVIDLLFHLPTGTIDRRLRPKLRDVVPGSIATVAVSVDSHRPPPPNRPRLPYRIETYDDTGTLTLTYFHAKRDYLEKLFPVGELRYISGETALYAMRSEFRNAGVRLTVVSGDEGDPTFAAAIVNAANATNPSGIVYVGGADSLMIA